MHRPIACWSQCWYCFRYHFLILKEQLIRSEMFWSSDQFLAEGSGFVFWLLTPMLFPRKGDQFLALGSDIVFLLLTPRVFTIHSSYFKIKKITSLISLIAASTRLLAWHTAATVLTAESTEISEQNPSPSSQTLRLALWKHLTNHLKDI